MNAQLESMHQQVARSEEQYRLLFEGLPVGVFFYDGTLRVIQANHALADILASDRSSARAMTCISSNLIAYSKPWRMVSKPITGCMRAASSLPESGESIMVSLRTAPLAR
jgi:PAS domain-containing protein